MAKTIRYGGAQLYPKQRAAIYDEHRWSLIEASPQPLDTTVYTPKGPRRFGSLKVGDEVCTPDGVTRVRDVFPLGERPVFRIILNDGTSTRATGDHRWTMEHFSRGERVVSTAEIAGWGRASRSNWRLPRIQPIAYPSHPVPMDPWLIGLLIGDGCLSRGNVVAFSSADPEIVERVRQTIAPGYEVNDSKGAEYLYVIRAAIRGAARVRANGGGVRFKANGYEASLGRRYLGRFKTLDAASSAKATATAEMYGDLAIKISLQNQLRLLGLMGKRAEEKRIPEVYRYNDEETRLEVLRGIMDSDGSATPYGAVLDQTSEQLALDVQELVEGLGGIARLTRSERRGQRVSWRLNIRHPKASSLFWLPRKKARCVDGASRTVRKIVDIVPDGMQRVQCIEIEDDKRLYLTDHAIPTHNTKSGKTIGCLSWLLEEALKNGKQGRNYWWVSPVFGQAFIGFERMRDRLPKNLYKQNQSVPHLSLVNGAKIVFKSAERPNDLYGEDVYAAVLDEASRMREDALVAMRSTITATRGPIRIIGNVAGRKNWFYRLCRAAEAGVADGMAFHRITCWDAVEAGVLAREEIEASRREFELLGKLGAWEQLYMASASDEAENPFGLKAIERCLLETVPQPQLDGDGNFVWQHPDGLKPLVAGVDLAGRGAQNINPSAETVERDYTAIVEWDPEGVCTHMERFRKPHTETANRVFDVLGRTPALVDSTGTGDALVEKFQRRGDMRVEGYTFTERSRQDLLEGLALAVQGMGIQFPDGPLRQELESFEYVYKPSGVTWRVPPGYHDDLTMAAALGVKKLPWKRRTQAPEVLLAEGGSTWGRADGGPGVDPLTGAAPATPPSRTQDAPTAGPILVSGGGGSRWTGADR